MAKVIGADMDNVTLARDEWVAVARELDAAFGESAPAGLRDRIAALLADTPAAWGEQDCTLALDAATADTVRAIVRRGRGLPADPATARSQAAGLAEAERVIHEYQEQPDEAVGSTYRVEHWTGDDVRVLGHTSAARARQADLSTHAGRLMAEGATGELVLIDEATGEIVARRYLRPEAEDAGASG